MSDSGKGNDDPFRPEESIPVAFHRRLVDERKSLLRTQERIPQRVALVRGYVDEFREDQLRLCPYLSDLVLCCFELLLHLQIRDQGFPNGLGQ